MNPKEVVFGSQARAEMQKGVDTLANAVKATLGPRGRHVAIERAYGPPLITKDGVTVARNILLLNPLQNMGAQLVKSVASAANAIAGDGTTTATVLAQAIYNEGAKMVAVGHNPVLVKKGIDLGVQAVVESLKANSVQVSDPETVKHVASISANNDMSIGSLISEAVAAVGNDGVISVEEATGLKTHLEYTDGFEVDRGYVSPAFITNEQRQAVELKNPLILFYDDRLSQTNDFINIISQIPETSRPILVIAKDIDGDALATLIYNKGKGALSCCAIKSPGFGDFRREFMSDLATLCGGKLFTNEDGKSVREAQLSDLGSAASVTINRNNTVIIGPKGNPGLIEGRIGMLREQMRNPNLHDLQRENIKNRLAKLSGGVAVIKVGGSTESEMRERKDRVEDAINAVKSAIQEGIVPGGGSALLHGTKALDSISTENLLPEEVIGIDIVRRSIRAPFQQILTNAGVEYHQFMHMIVDGSARCGYDALRGIFVEDMVSAGIIDPAKVVRSALEHAASASGTLLTTEVTIFDLEEPVTK